MIYRIFHGLAELHLVKCPVMVRIFSNAERVPSFSQMWQPSTGISSHTIENSTSRVQMCLNLPLKRYFVCFVICPNVLLVRIDVLMLILHPGPRKNRIIADSLGPHNYKGMQFTAVQ